MLSMNWTEESLRYKAIAIAGVALFLAAFAPLSCLRAWGDTTGDIFVNAEVLYEAKDYDGAIALYETILAGGKTSGELYYNLGNAYLLKGSIGKAILSYIRARALLPRDGAIEANYQHALSLMKQRESPAREAPIALEIRRIFRGLALGEMMTVFASCYYACIFVIIAALFANRSRALLWIGAATLLMVALSAAVPLKAHIRDREAGAIVILPVIDALREPIDGAETAFPLYEGMKVYTLKSKMGWQKIKRLDGKIGWIASGGIESISR